VRTLFVEDNLLLAKSTARSLKAEHFTVDVFHTADDAWEAWTGGGAYDVVVLDLMLGGDHGLDLLARARLAGLTTPVLVLTALGEVDDRVRGLNRGADDYLVKPFAVNELIARLRALGRRPDTMIEPLLTFGAATYDQQGLILSGPGGQVAVTRAESMLLERFFRRPDRVISKDQLGDALHPLECSYTENSLHILVSRVRKRLDQVQSGIAIQALRGLGYVATTGRQ
jgi:DNA-binding response OmpR family regulator